MKKQGCFIFLMAILFFPASSLVSQTVNVNRGFEKGTMEGIYKTGTWQYYDSTGNLDLEIDYDHGILTYQKPDSSEYIILKDGEWIASRLDIQPRYIGSWVEFYDILNNHVDYPMQAWYRDVVGKVSILFEVDTTGQANNFIVLNDIGCECAYECERVLRLVPNYWLVATKEGKKYKSRFVITCEFGIVLDGKRLKEKTARRRKNTADSLAIPLARELKGISYIIEKGYNPR